MAAEDGGGVGATAARPPARSGCHGAACSPRASGGHSGRAAQVVWFLLLGRPVHCSWAVQTRPNPRPPILLFEEHDLPYTFISSARSAAQGPSQRWCD